MSKKKKPAPVPTPTLPAPAGNLFGTGQVVTSPAPPPAPVAPPPFIPPHHDGQFTTLPEAMLIATLVNTTGLGGGVLPYNANNDAISGIFIAKYEQGPFPTPIGGVDEEFYHLRFANGKIANAGLVASLMAFSTNWPAMLKVDIGA